jgi:hypothetical protein
MRETFAAAHASVDGPWLPEHSFNEEVGCEHKYQSSNYAGQSVALVHKRQPAAEIVREIVSEAQATFRRGAALRRDGLAYHFAPQIIRMLIWINPVAPAPFKINRSIVEHGAGS